MSLLRCRSDEWAIAVAVVKRAQDIQVERMRNIAETQAILTANNLGKVLR